VSWAQSDPRPTVPATAHTPGSDTGSGRANDQVKQRPPGHELPSPEQGVTQTLLSADRPGVKGAMSAFVRAAHPSPARQSVAEVQGRTQRPPTLQVMPSAHPRLSAQAAPSAAPAPYWQRALRQVKPPGQSDGPAHEIKQTPPLSCRPCVSWPHERSRVHDEQSLGTHRRAVSRADANPQ
jgi:hypothetical protein